MKVVGKAKDGFIGVFTNGSMRYRRSLSKID